MKRKIGRIWGMRRVQVAPVVIGAIGNVTKEFDKRIEKLDIPCDVIDMQKTALLRAARILRKVLIKGMQIRKKALLLALCH